MYIMIGICGHIESDIYIIILFIFNIYIYIYIVFLSFTWYLIQQKNSATTYYASKSDLTPWKYNKYNILLQLLTEPRILSTSQPPLGQNTAPLRNPRSYTAMVSRVTRMLPGLWWPSNLGSEIGTAALGHKKRFFDW